MATKFITLLGVNGKARIVNVEDISLAEEVLMFDNTIAVEITLRNGKTFIIEEALFDMKERLERDCI